MFVYLSKCIACRFKRRVLKGPWTRHTALLYSDDWAPCSSQQFCSAGNVAAIIEKFVSKGVHMKLPSCYYVV